MKTDYQKKMEILSKVAEVKVRYTRKVAAKDRIKCINSDIAVDVFRAIWNDEGLDYRERSYLLFVNRRNDIIGSHELGIGSNHGTVIDMQSIFTLALKLRSSGVILAHNHPSGETQPSQQDKTLTKKIKEAGKLIEIELIDHVILTSETHYSFADENLI